MTEPMPPDHDGAGHSGVRSVQRAVEIMSLLTDQHPAITIREIVEATGLPKTTVLRIVQTLDHNGLLSATPTGYMAGPGLWRWAHLAKTSWEAPAETRSLLRDLADRQKETVNIYVMHRLSRVCVVQEESPMPLRHVVKVGDELPLWAGASAKVLLQNAPDHLLEQVAAASPFGIEHARTLRDWTADAQDQGFAISHGEREVGLSAVAVPVTGRFDAVVAALSFSGPTSRFTDDRIDEFATELQSAAAKLAERGFDHPLRTPLDRSSR